MRQWGYCFPETHRAQKGDQTSFHLGLEGERIILSSTALSGLTWSVLFLDKGES